jgi:hypothetical protein
MSSVPDMPDSHQLVELRELLACLCEAELTSTQAAQLAQMVSTDPACAWYYVNAMQVHAVLPQYAGVGHTISGAKLIAEWQSRDNESEKNMVRAFDVPSTRQEKVSAVHRNSLIKSLPTSRFIGWAASLLLVCYFLIVIGLLVSDRIHRALDSIAVRSDVELAAQLTRADDATWHYEPSAKSNDQTLQVRTGLAELTFARGAKVVVQGPAEFEVRSPSRGFLRRGRLLATVPPQAIGFTIETPKAEIVDLGTEFGVEVDDQQNAEVHVFKGVVEARQLSMELAQHDVVRVTEGNALRIDSQQRQPTPVTIRSAQQLGFVKEAKIKSIDRNMLVAEWDFLKDQDLTFAANGASKTAKLSGGATIDRGVALGALSGNRQLASGFLNVLRTNGEPHDEGIITEASWAQLFGSSDLTRGSFVVVFKPNPAQWTRYVLMSHLMQAGEFGQIFASFEQNDTNTTSEVLLRVGQDDTEAAMTIPALKKTDWYFLGGSWSPGEKSFLYLRNITDGTLCGTAIANVPVKMKEGVMKGPIHLGMRNSDDKLSESANSLFAYAALIYPYWNTVDQFDQFYFSLIDPPGQKEPRGER